MSTITIECACGEVKLEVSGEPLVSVYCHCDDCQAVHGAAYLPAAIYRLEQVRVVAGLPAIWRRKTTARGFCGRCGTRLYAEPEGAEFRSLSAYLLPDAAFRPSCHINCQFALLPVRDDLPHFRGFPAAMGGSDERVPW
jgi:hypothetical protein